MRFVHDSGRVVWAQLAGAHVGQSPEGVDRGVLVAIDVTERHDLEESLLHARKVEAIGRLAGGVAHDFNNLITVASGHLELMLLENPDRHDLEPHVAGLREALGRAAELTQRLLAFARREALVPRAIRPGDLVRRTERMLRPAIGPDIELVVTVGGEPDPIRVDPVQIEQMLVSLVVNARDAMPEGGRIAIEAANETLDEHRLAGIPDVKPGPYVRFSVTDTGTGMDAETLAHCLVGDRRRHRRRGDGRAGPANARSLAGSRPSRRGGTRARSGALAGGRDGCSCAVSPRSSSTSVSYARRADPTKLRCVASGEGA